MAEPRVPQDASKPVLPPVATPKELAIAELPEETAEALGDGTISQTEIEDRQKGQEEVHSRIKAKEMARAAEHVDSFVQQGYLSTNEGDTVRQLGEINERVKRGEIDSDEASRLRNSLLSKEQRYALEKKIKGAVDQAVRFLQAFESMQRINPDLDDGLRFLIYHKNILDDTKGPAERRRAAQELLEDREMLHQIIDIMDRKDQEVRMISVGLPPYSYVVNRNERIGNMIVEEEFIDDLRKLTSEDVSDRLHSDDPQVRVRPAADIRCVIALVSHLIKPTAWRKDVRLLRVQDTIEQLYSDSDDMGEARKQAESFLNRRLRRMFRDLSGEKKTEMEQRGAEVIDAIEQRVTSERATAADEQAKADAETPKKSDARGPEDDGLTEDELKKGATIGQVEMRVTGQMRRVPRKIMCAPLDAAVFVFDQRNPDTGDLEPVLRCAKPRIIKRGNDGLWRLTSN